MRTLGLGMCLLVALAVGSVARVGGWLDEIVFLEETDQPKVLAMINAGELQFFANAFMGSNLPIIEGYGLPYKMSYGKYRTILLNPEGPTFADGRFNPIHDAVIQQALQRLTDRQYLIDDFCRGLGVPMYCSLLPVSPTYAEIAVQVRQTEIEFAYDKALAIQQISDRMFELGCYQIDGRWAYNGEKITLIGIIRIEDERLQIGLQFADWLEEAGFLVDRQQKRSADASLIWNHSDPKLGLWHYYTGGWIANSIDRESDTNFCTHYTDVCYPTSRTVEYPDEVDATMYDYAIRIANGQFATPEERIGMFNYMVAAERQNPFNIWLYVEAAPWVIPQGLSVTVDLMAGIFGSRMWARTMRYVDNPGKPMTGGSVYIANQGFLTEPWNGPAGSGSPNDALIQRALEDPAMLTDSFTGLAVRNFVERVDITATEGLPIFASEKDWVGLTFVSAVYVPEDAWYDWDAAAEDFVLAGPGRTSQAKIRYTFPEALWSWKWHDGSNISMGDLLMGFIYGSGMDTAKEGSPYYDESTVPSYEANWTVFRGLKVISVHPLIYDLYVDSIALDAEVLALNNQQWFWFTYRHGTQAWHNMAVGLMSEERGLAAFSQPKATERGIDWLSYAAGPTLTQMATNLVEAQVTNFLPYPNVLGKYVTQQEIVDRYANLNRFVSQYGHMYIGTGPYRVVNFDPLASIIVLNRFADYAFDLDRFLVFAEPKLASLTVTGPVTVLIGSQAEFNVSITYRGEAYPWNEIKSVGYIVLDSAGQVAFSGDAVVTSDGAATIILPAAETAKLISGPSRLEIVATVSHVALVSTTYTTFVADGGGVVAPTPADYDKLLANIDATSATVTTDTGEWRAAFDGRVGFSRRLGPAGEVLSLMDFALVLQGEPTPLEGLVDVSGNPVVVNVAAGMPTSRGLTGLISFSLPNDASSFDLVDWGGGEYEVAFTCALHFDLIDKIRGFVPGSSDPSEGEDDVLASHTENATGSMHIRLAPAQSDKVLLVADLTLSTESAGETADLVRGIKIRLNVLLHKVLGWAGVHQVLAIQPVFIGPDVRAAVPVPRTGGAFPALMNWASAVWDRCGSVQCIRFDVRNALVLVAPQSLVNYFRDLPNAAAPCLRHTVMLADAVEVFVVRDWENPMANGGGGTMAPGLASAAVITCDAQLDIPCPVPCRPCAAGGPVNLRHLAHELGHVLALDHPGGVWPGLVRGSALSVMEPSGLCADNPNCQSWRNCWNATSPLLRWSWAPFACGGGPDPGCP